MKSLIFPLFALLFLSSCEMFQKTYDLDVKNSVYRRDIKIKCNGSTFNGVGVLESAPAYKCEFTCPGKADLFTFETCHRHVTHEDAGKPGGIFNPNAVVKYEYRPSKIEDDGYCSIHIGCYEESKGRHAWGFLDVEDREHKLPSLVHCNGELERFNGVSVCQSRTGLIQTIHFDEVVKIYDDKKCRFEADGDDGESFNFKVVRGHCVYGFLGLVSGEIHRLTTIGYDAAPIRKVY